MVQHYLQQHFFKWTVLRTASRSNPTVTCRQCPLPQLGSEQVTSRGGWHSWARSSAGWNNLIRASFTHTGEACGGQTEVIYPTMSRHAAVGCCRFCLVLIFGQINRPNQLCASMGLMCGENLWNVSPCKLQENILLWRKYNKCICSFDFFFFSEYYDGQLCTWQWLTGKCHRSLH